MTPIHTYYDPAVSAVVFSQDGKHEDQRAILDVWQKSWATRGWTPIVQGPEDAKRHPSYAAVTGHVTKEHRGPNPLIYELACFHRWLALANSGGGYACDYDVFNYSLPTLPPRELKFEVLYSTPGCPCFVYASDRGLAWFIQQMLTFKLADAPDGSYSDQSLCRFLINTANLAGHENLLGKPTRFCIGSWDVGPAPLIHFPHVCCPAGRLAALKSYPRSLF